MDVETGSWRVDENGVVILSDGTRLLPWNIESSRHMTPEMLRASAIAVGEIKVREQRVCVCGHPVTRHMVSERGTACSPTRMVCHCSEIVPVIDASDVRPFLRKTKSIKHHALTAGQNAMTVKGRTWSWLPGEPHCFLCQKRGMPVVPLLIDRGNNKPVVVVTDSTTFDLEDILCCRECCHEQWPFVTEELWPDGWKGLEEDKR